MFDEPHSEPHLGAGPEDEGRGVPPSDVTELRSQRVPHQAVPRTHGIPSAREPDAARRPRALRRGVPVRGQPAAPHVRQQVGPDLERAALRGGDRAVHRRGGQVHHSDQRLLLPGRRPHNIRVLPVDGATLPEVLPGAQAGRQGRALRRAGHPRRGARPQPRAGGARGHAPQASKDTG